MKYILRHEKGRVYLDLAKSDLASLYSNWRFKMVGTSRVLSQIKSNRNIQTEIIWENPRFMGFPNRQVLNEDSQFITVIPYLYLS